MRQVDLICGNCPLDACDEESLWCLFRFVTDPNEAQQRLVNKSIRKKRSKVKRREYYARQYQANREKKLAAANLRNQKLRSGEIGA